MTFPRVPSDRVVLANRRVTFVRRTSKRHAWLIEWWNGLLIISAPTWLINVHVHRFNERKE